MKIKTAELTSAALDWAVTKCEGNHVTFDEQGCESGSWEKYSSRWSKGGPIIEREFIYLSPDAPYWKAAIYDDTGDCVSQLGPTPLIAAMRCYVASTLGKEVEIPEELL